MGKKVTIVDVAAAAGVTPSTVSHALSGKRTISRPVKQKIFAIIKELGYRPQFQAQALKNTKTMLIGSVVDSYGVNSMTTLLNTELTRQLNAVGYQLIVCIAGNGEENGRAVLRRLSTGMCDGIINCLPQIDENEASFLCEPVPAVTLERNSQAPIVIDYAGWMNSALELLWARGHRRIAYIASLLNSFNGRDPAADAFEDFMRAHGVAEEDCPVVCSDRATGINGEVCCEKIFRKKPVSAIIASSDRLAGEVYYWCFRHQLSIPGDVSVIGCDDFPTSAQLTPPLTTGILPVSAIAELTVRDLLARLGKAEARKQTALLPLPLIRRGSVAAPPAGIRDLFKKQPQGKDTL